MKKTLLLCACAVSTLAAMADWSSSVSDLTPVFPTGTNQYAIELRATTQDGVWAMMYHPNTKNAAGETDIENVRYEYRMQYFDKDGNPAFPEDGLLVSDFKNKSYTVINDYLTTDGVGNAILAVLDQRNSAAGLESYTAYKVSPEGDLLWGEEGKPISDEVNPSETVAKITSAVLDDGSVVFAWLSMGADGATDVRMQRLDKDGNKCWDEEKVSLLGDQCSYPYLIPSGDNTCILVYSRTASEILYARKLDFEGSNVWGQDTRIYRGGFGSTPLHLHVNVVPSGDGGSLVAWYDDRKNTNIESAYLSYITPDGKLGFANASDEGDVKLGFDDMRAFQVDAAPSADGSCFYAAWRETDYNQNFQGVKVQKVSKAGELLWDENGIDIAPMEHLSTGYISVQTAGKDQAVVFYMKYYEYFNQIAYAQLVNSDGTFAWNESVQLSEENHKSSSLESIPLAGHDSWYFYYDESKGESDAPETIRLGKLNINGTIGTDNSAVESVVRDDSRISFDGQILRAVGKTACIYTPDGVLVSRVDMTSGQASLNLAKGIYLIRVDGRAAAKFTVSK